MRVDNRKEVSFCIYVFEVQMINSNRECMRGKMNCPFIKAFTTNVNRILSTAIHPFRDRDVFSSRVYGSFTLLTSAPSFASFSSIFSYPLSRW
jgi:hypothetical protein